MNQDTRTTERVISEHDLDRLERVVISTQEAKRIADFVRSAAVDSEIAATLAQGLRDFFGMDTETGMHRREGDLEPEDRDFDAPEDTCCECEDDWPCYVERARRALVEFDRQSEPKGGNDG